VLLVLLAVTLLAHGTAGAESSPRKAIPRWACREGMEFAGDNRTCAPDPTHQEILVAKARAANAYHDYLRGDGGREAYDIAQRIVERLTGEQIGAHANSQPATTSASLKLRGATAVSSPTSLQASFWPFEQITWWYCGPATAQSILWFLGPRQSQAYDEVWGGYPSLSGDPFEDQWLLANDFWLATNKYEGTLWGAGYMPFTLNAWRGTKWYVQSEALGAGGDLTKEQALIVMRYAFDHNYPVAENVLYDNSTYYPFGFWPGITYQHWDTAYGYVEDADGVPYLKIGQPYHEPDLPYERFQQVAWDIHWGAIANWHGIVW
jgi:hypothetical protein